MEAPVFVKCEPGWPSDEEESSNAEQPPFVNYEDIKVEPSEEEETSTFVKEEHPVEDPGLEDCDNDEQSPNQIQPILNGADRHHVMVGDDGSDYSAEMKCEEGIWNSSSISVEYSSQGRDDVAVSSPSQSKATTPESKIKYRDLLSCGKCGKSYSRPGHLVEFKHVGTLFCRQCYKECSKESGPKQHPCEQCGKMFSDVYKLRRHELVHNKVKRRLCCTQCDKEFRSRESLNSHMNSHTGARPHKCSICNKVYARIWSLKRHATIHTGQRPHVCETCGKVFAVRANLIKHTNTHTGERSFSCTVCTKAFSEKYTLKTHMLTHTGEKPYHCPKCGMTFSSRSTRSRHMLKHTTKNT